jgi:hypothetical protein
VILRSPQLTHLKGTDPDLDGFDYWTEGVFDDVSHGFVIFRAPTWLSFTVLDQESRTLGTENLELHVEVRFYPAWEGP